MFAKIQVLIVACGICVIAPVLGCADEESDSERPDTEADVEVSDSELDGVDDSSTSSDADEVTENDATIEDTASGDARSDAADAVDSGAPCTMGVSRSEGGCQCDTHLARCCWGSTNMSCTVPPDQPHGYWGEVFDADWNCDEEVDCEEFEGVPPP